MPPEPYRTDDPLAQALEPLQVMGFPSFFKCQTLTAQLLNSWVNVQRQYMAYVGRLFAGSGILEGLRIECNDPGCLFKITSGAAIDPLGRLVVVPSDKIYTRADIAEFEGPGQTIVLQISLHLQVKKSGEKERDTKSQWLFGYEFVPQKIDIPHPVATTTTVDDSAGVIVGIVRLTPQEDGFEVVVESTQEALAYLQRRRELTNLALISDYLTTQRRRVTLTSTNTGVCAVPVNIASTPIVVELTDAQGMPVPDTGLKVTCSSHCAQVRPSNAKPSSQFAEHVSLSTDKDGKICFECRCSKRGQFAVSVSMSDPAKDTDLVSPLHFTVCGVELFSWDGRLSSRGIVGERVALKVRIENLANPCRFGEVRFGDGLDEAKAEPDPDDPNLFVAQWEMRRLGRHFVCVRFYSPEGAVLAHSGIPVEGEFTRIEILEREHQECAFGDELPHPFTIRVTRQDGTPVARAELNLSGTRWNIEMGIRSEQLVKKGDKSTLFTDAKGEAVIWWKPFEHGFQALSVRHVGLVRQTEGKTYGDVESQLSTNEVHIFANTRNAVKTVATVQAQDTHHDSRADNE